MFFGRYLFTKHCPNKQNENTGRKMKKIYIMMAVLCGSLLSANAGIIFNGSTVTNTGKKTGNFPIRTDMTDWNSYTNTDLSASFSKKGGNNIGALSFISPDGDTDMQSLWVGKAVPVWTPSDEVNDSINDPSLRMGILTATNINERFGDYFKLTITASTAANYRLTVYGGAKNLDLDLIATENGGAATLTNTNWDFGDSAGSEAGTWTVDFTAENDSDSFDVQLMGVAGFGDTGGQSKIGFTAVTLEVIPEPAALGMMMLACGGLFLARRKTIKH